MTTDNHSSSGETGRELFAFSTGAPDMLHLCDCRISFGTEPTVGLFSATALARLLKMSDECVKQVRDSVKSNEA
jgi:hypothetical protein